jgi:small ubiquitin-related modifier
MEAYAQKKGVAVNSFRYSFDGNRVRGDDTPKMLEMDDNDQIDVFLEATGGRRR